jgi:TRAP-type C4-dicarboxylate transport system, small permease component
MKHIPDALGRAGSLVLSMTLLAMVALNCMTVVLRYVWGTSLLWTDEVLVYGMVAMVFVAAVGVSVRDQHLRMTLFTETLPLGLQRAIFVVEQLLTAGICLFVGWYSLKATAMLMRRGTVSNMAEIPLWLVNGAVLVGLAGIALAALWRLYVALARKGG